MIRSPLPPLESRVEANRPISAAGGMTQLRNT